MSFAPLPNEPVFALPTARLLTAVTIASVIVAGAWLAVTSALSKPPEIKMAGLAGAGVVLVVSVAGILAMMPWKSRPASLWMTFWLAATVFRMLAAPALTFLLYSSAPLDAMSLTLSVAVAYLVVLLTETAMVARHVSKAA